MRGASFLLSLTFAIAFNSIRTQPAVAWGDEGPEIVALVAQSFLDPDVRDKVAALLATDKDTLTAHDIAEDATWPDKYRDAHVDGSRQLLSHRRVCHHGDERRFRSALQGWGCASPWS